MNDTKRTLIALIPLGTIIVLLALVIIIWGADSIAGSSQVVLLIGAGLCMGLSTWLYKTPWKEFEKAIMENVGEVSIAIIILFMIGAIAGLVVYFYASQPVAMWILAISCGFKFIELALRILKI